MKDFFSQKRPHNGLTYNQYANELETLVNSANPDLMDEKELEYYNYRKMNLQRSSRVEKTYAVSDELKTIIQNIKDEQIWMIITESWCGDSAQNVPYIAKMAELNDKITLRLLYRDENLDIMDEYLTNGTSRSIPKMVVFDSEGNELFQWGPRPQELVDQIEEWKKTMEPKEWKEKIHLWYGRNRGAAIENEFIGILKQFN